MLVLRDFGHSVSAAGKLYLLVAIIGAVTVFVGVEGWRLLVWVVAQFQPQMVGTDDLASAALLAASGAVYVLTSSYEHRHAVMTGAYVVQALLHVTVGTGSLYGLLDAAAGLVPDLPSFDVFAATCLGMSAILAAYVLFHRRLRR